MTRFQFHKWLRALNDDVERVGRVESHVAHIIADYMYNGSASLTKEFISQGCRYDRRTVQRAIRNLELAGYLKVSRSGGPRASVYEAAFPS